MMHGQKNIKSS